MIGSDTTRIFADSRGRDTAVVDPLGHTTKIHYDTSFGNADSALAEGNRWSRTYFDHFGRDSLHTANHKPADTTTYDSMNRVARVALPGLGAVSMSYDALFATGLKDPKRNVYRTSVDALGRVSKRYDPADTLNRFQSYRYDLDNLLTSWTDRRGQRTDMAYDSLGRVLAKTGAGVMPDTFSFNPTGTVVVAWSAAERDSTFSSPIGWPDSIVTWLEPAHKRFRRFYHRSSSTNQMDSIGIATTSGIHFANRYFTWDPVTAALERISTSAPQRNYGALTFTPELLDSTISWGDSVTETLSHTSRHEVMSTNFTVVAINRALSRSYSYDDSLGHISQVNRQYGLDGEARLFTYTNSDQLGSMQVDSLTSAVSCPPPTGKELTDDGYDCQSLTNFVPVHRWGFIYDSAGNLLSARDSVPNSVSSGTYTAGNRLGTWGSAHYTIDPDGNDSIKIVGSDTTRFNWTADERLKSVTAGSVSILYTYGPTGQLAQRWRSIAGGQPVLERQFLWDQGQLMAELDSTATKRIAEYAYWPGTDNPYALMTGTDSIKSTRYFAQDQLGNVIGLFTGATVPQSLIYQPFGTLDSAYSTLGAVADTNRLRWKGLVYEGDSTRLYYVRNRWYDPVAGRFASEDPLGQNGGLNLYAFGGDDPVNGIDPTGLDACFRSYTAFQMDAYGNQDSPSINYWAEVPMSECGDGGSSIMTFTNDPNAPNDAPVADPVDAGITPEERAQIIIDGVARGTKGFNQLANCGMAASLAGVTAAFDLDGGSELVSFIKSSISSSAAKEVAYNSVMGNITGQNAAARAVQTAATRVARSSGDAASRVGDDFSQDELTNDLPVASVSFGVEQYDDAGKRKSFSWSSLLDFVPGAATVKAIQAVKEHCSSGGQ